MSDFVNRATLEIVISGNDPDYPDPPWLKFSNRTAALTASAIPQQYRKVESDAVVEMNRTEKDAVDAAEATKRRTTNRSAAIGSVDDTDTQVGHETRSLLLNPNKRINWLTNRVIELQEDLQAIKATSGGGDNIRGAIRASYLATSTRTLPQAIQAYKDDINAGEADS